VLKLPDGSFDLLMPMGEMTSFPKTHPKARAWRYGLVVFVVGLLTFEAVTGLSTCSRSASRTRSWCCCTRLSGSCSSSRLPDTSSGTGSSSCQAFLSYLDDLACVRETLHALSINQRYQELDRFLEQIL